MWINLLLPRMGKKITGTRLSPNTRYLVYQPRLTDALIAICQLLSYEHPRKRQEKNVSYSHLTNSTECDIIWSYLTANAERTSHEQKQSIHKISEEIAYQSQETYYRRGKHLELQIRGSAQQGEDTLLLPDVPGQVPMTVNRRGIFAEWIRWSTRIKHRKESKPILQAAISQFTQNAKFGDVKRTILSRKQALP